MCTRTDFHRAIGDRGQRHLQLLPNRDGRIEAIENGQPESEWVSERLGRSIIKAWNAVDSATLVNASGFDAVDAGSLSDSWRQQPGSPVYCTQYAGILGRNRLGLMSSSLRRDRFTQGRCLLSEQVETDERTLLELIATIVEMSADVEVCWAGYYKCLHQTRGLTK